MDKQWGSLLHNGILSNNKMEQKYWHILQQMQLKNYAHSRNQTQKMSVWSHLGKMPRRDQYLETESKLVISGVESEAGL